jgi:hypothetical protein
MDNMVSSDGQNLRAWYPSVWSSRREQEAQVARTSLNGIEHQPADERFKAALRQPRLAEFSPREPDMASPALTESDLDEFDMNESDLDEHDLAGILEDEDLSQARFDLDVWNEDANLDFEPFTSGSSSSSEPVSGDESSREDEHVPFIEVPERWVFTASGLGRGRTKQRSRGRPSRSHPPVAELEHSAPEHSAPEHSAPEVVAAPSRPTIRGGRHRRRGHTIQEPEVEGFLSAPEPGTEGVAVLVGMPEGSRFASVIRVLAIAVPAAGVTMAFLAYFR